MLLRSSDAIKASKSSFSCNRQLQDKFVILLRLLLLWDPKERGGSVQENGKKECYDVLEKITKTMVCNFHNLHVRLLEIKLLSLLFSQ